MVTEAALPMPSCPRLPRLVTGVATIGAVPRCWPKSNDHLIEPWLPPPLGGETAYRLPVRAAEYTVPSGATAGATLTVWPNGASPVVPVWAVHLTLPVG